MASQILVSGAGLSPDILIEVARRELAQGGLRALSFRRLGEAAGVTLGALTYHLGSKANILSQIVAAERRRDATRHVEWRDRLKGLDRIDGEALATILEHYLDDAVTGDPRVTQLIFADLSLRSAVDTEAAALMVPWVRERQMF
jgi:AcrR family transcriptional regulator